MEDYKPLFVDEERRTAPPPPMPPMPVEEIPPERFDVTRRDGIFAVLIALSTLFTVMWGLWHNFMLGWTVSYLLLFIISTIYVLRKGVHVTPFSAACGGLSVILSFVFSITTTFSVRFFGFFVSLVLMFIWFGTMVADRNNSSDLGVLHTAAAPIFRLGFRHVPTAARSLFTGGSQGRTFGKILIGVAIALPALSIVVPLLMKSDAAFEVLATRLIENLRTTVGQVFVGGLVMIFVVPYCMAVRHRTLKTPERAPFGGVDGVVLGTILSLLSACYLAYLFSQLAYFFSAFSGFLPEGYTFTVAEYARRGFFEMSAIAAINLAIIFLVQILARQENGKMHGVLRALCAFIALFTLLIIATSISKMVLYIELFGLTTLRVTTTAFMVFLAVVFFSVILRLFTARVKVLKTAAITAGLVLAVLGIFNVNHVVAAYNYHAYQHGWLDTIDVLYMYDIGEEGIPYVLELTYAEDEAISKPATEYMEYYYKDFWKYYTSERVFAEDEGTYWLKLDKIEETEWTEWNLPRHRAEQALERYAQENPLLFSEDGTVNS